MKLSSKLQTSLVFAARYVHHRATTRRTLLPSGATLADSTGGTLVVTEALRDVWGSLDDHTRKQILRESEEASANLHDWEKFWSHVGYMKDDSLKSDKQ